VRVKIRGSAMKGAWKLDPAGRVTVGGVVALGPTPGSRSAKSHSLSPARDHFISPMPANVAGRFSFHRRRLPVLRQARRSSYHAGGSRRVFLARRTKRPGSSGVKQAPASMRLARYYRCPGRPFASGCNRKPLRVRSRVTAGRMCDPLNQSGARKVPDSLMTADIGREKIGSAYIPEAAR
jgi:hypothetical protein